MPAGIVNQVETLPELTLSRKLHRVAMLTTGPRQLTSG